MSASGIGDGTLIRKFACGDGGRYVIYNASTIGNPFDHRADKWYFLPWPAPPGIRAGEPFDTAEDAMRAAHSSSSAVSG